MTTFLLIRHAQNDWVRTGRLAGWTEGVHLNEEGQRQAALLGERLATAKLVAIYSSPLERAVETAEAIAAHHDALELQIEAGIGEVDFGEWTGKRLKKLARTRLWRVVQGHPSGARFPGGESFLEMQFRLVSTLDMLAQRHPTGQVAIVAHSDVIKAVFAHYAGIHLDLFQRIVVSPASLTIVALSRFGPHIVRLNDTSHYESPKESGSDA
ncbi:MAG: MSMEG_4193 family putative phosphomutase [Chloroflexi bacterium]|nr:MSMEG_4193 family putative phosphomutase [Chloroflexota bacterium]